MIASQLYVHARYGGVVPELASREHLRSIVPVVRQAMSDAQVGWPDLSAIAVTNGPGLVGSLLVGVTYAKALAFARRLPLIGVNHVEGHIHSVLLGHPEIVFPALALVVSGGHTHLFAVSAPGHYRLLGKTRDDAAGEAYDKVAKLLGFGYPGGPLIDRLAPYGNPKAIRFASPKMKGHHLDFSFSGIKTAVLRWTQAQPDFAAEVEQRRHSGASAVEQWLAVTPARTLDLIASFQRSVIDELLAHAREAASAIGATQVLIAGGVASNRDLQTRAANLQDLQFFFPPPDLATDNAAMIAAAALPKWKRREFASLALMAAPSLPLVE